MWDEYPGNQRRNYVPPPGPPPFPRPGPPGEPYGFPSPDAMPPSSESRTSYRPDYGSYAPPPAPPPFDPYGPPPGPPPGGFPEPGYPGQGFPGEDRPHHHHHHHHSGYSSSESFTPPPGPPPSIPPRTSYGAPPAIPPRPGGNYASAGYAAPPGPPPSQMLSPSSINRQGASTPYHYAPPPGAPPPQYSQSGTPSSHYAPPSGPPLSHSPHPYGAPAQSSGRYAPPPGPPPRPPAEQQHYGPVWEGPNHQREQPYFQYSQCTGRRKALCIGINYIGTSQQLKGCINDANNVRSFLISEYGYKGEDIVMLTDDQANPRAIPTRMNMIQAMQWLVRDARPNDSLFFHYSGHGGLTKDLDGDEESGYDEVIYPLDFKVNGQIVDDELHDMLVKPLPPGCRLTALFDSCHSGSVLDLPWMYSHEGKIKEPNLAAEAAQGLLGAVSSYARGDIMGAIGSVTGLVKEVTGHNQTIRNKKRETKTSPADVICWGGCKDQQTSADTFEGGEAVGAMSYAFMTCIRQNKQQSYQQLLVNVREILYGKYTQKPQLSSSHPIDTSLMFIC